MGIAAVKRSGWSCRSPAVTMPPSECPQAIVRDGVPTRVENVSNVEI